MANFTPTKKQVSDFNNGIKYVNKVDTPSADDFNNVIESQLYSQNFAESIADTPDTSEASQVGVPSVTLINNIKNGVAYKKFKFANMKGDTGGVAPVENSQSNNTNTVPSSKLLKESSFARVYGSLAELGLTSTATPEEVGAAMIDNSITELNITSSNAPNIVPSYVGGQGCTVTFKRKTVNVISATLQTKLANSTNSYFLTGSLRNNDLTNKWSGWKQLAPTDNPTFTGTVTVPAPTNPTDAARLQDVTGLSAGYDKVIRTQAEFETLISSPTWIGAQSVALVGAFSLSTANNSGVKIPATVKQIHGFNSAKITVTNFVYNPSTGKGGLWYDTRPTTLDYSIRDLEVDCTGAGTSGIGVYNCTNLTNCTGTGTGTYGWGFWSCTNLTNCTGTATATATGANGYGFRDCTNLANCTGTGTGTGGGYGFVSCTNLTNCTGAGTGPYGIGFYNITYASNCRDGGSTSAMWGGINKNIGIDDSSAQTITGVKTFSVSPLVPTTPSGASAAVAKVYVDSIAIKQPAKTYVLYYATAGTNNLYLSAVTYTHTYASAGAYLITISGTGSSATVDWGDGTSGTVDLTGGFNINNQADKDKYIEVHLGTNCAVIGNSAFYGCSRLTSITIPYSVTSIGDFAFYGCYRLTSITIPDSVTSIGNGAFNVCTKLTSITIPDSVTSIGNNAFRGCSGLTSITIPYSVTSIGTNAFYDCSGLTSITFLNTTLPTIGITAFGYCRIADIIAISSSLADSAASAITTAGGTLLTNYRKLY